jgi:hypothetical protein
VIALHGGSELSGRDEDIAVAGNFAAGSDEAEAIAMQVEAPGN